MKFLVTIQETLSLTKEVEATSHDDALKYVRALYNAEEIVLTGDNAQTTVSFSAQSHDTKH